MATVSVSMATRSSHLDDQKSSYVQTESHTFTPPSSQDGPEETEAFGIAPLPFTIPVSGEEANARSP